LIDRTTAFATAKARLGFQVRITKASGDQGGDLVLTGKGQKTAIQANGYANSLANDAIQEVFAGMTFYGCDRCAAITKSVFTKPAQELAVRARCQLIDEFRIHELIQGQIL
jgi:restriction system protein